MSNKPRRTRKTNNQSQQHTASLGIQVLRRRDDDADSTSNVEFNHEEESEWNEVPDVVRMDQRHAESTTPLTTPGQSFVSSSQNRYTTTTTEHEEDEEEYGDYEEDIEYNGDNYDHRATVGRSFVSQNRGTTTTTGHEKDHGDYEEDIEYDGDGYDHLGVVQGLIQGPVAEEARIKESKPFPRPIHWVLLAVIIAVVGGIAAGVSVFVVNGNRQSSVRYVWGDSCSFKDAEYACSNFHSASSLTFCQ